MLSGNKLYPSLNGNGISPAETKFVAPADTTESSILSTSPKTRNFTKSLTKKAQEIRCLGRQYGLSANRIELCFSKVLEDLSSKKTETRKNVLFSCNCFSLVLLLFILFFSCYWLLSCYKPAQTFVSRNVQDLIYPCMRLLRYATMWLHQRFPHITIWHEQQCLIDNPWFTNLDLNCWPCEEIRSITNLTTFPNYVQAYLHNGIPFVIKDIHSSNNFALEQLENLYAEYENELKSGTGYFRSNVPSLSELKDIFEAGKSLKLHEYNKIHIEWQLKRVSAARVMRSLFPKPKFVPNTTEVALERYLFIDGPSTLTYSIPITEFANVWLHQKIGRRVVTFQPSPNCKDSCSTISTVIFAGDILFYNWQYWHLSFQPSACSLSVTYMGSFY